MQLRSSFGIAEEEQQIDVKATVPSSRSNSATRNRRLNAVFIVSAQLHTFGAKPPQAPITPWKSSVNCLPYLDLPFSNFRRRPTSQPWTPAIKSSNGVQSPRFPLPFGASGQARLIFL